MATLRSTDAAARILDSISDAFLVLDQEWRFTYLNAPAERLLGRTRMELLEKNVWAEFPAAVGTAFEREFRRAVATQSTVSFEEYYPPPLDAWYEVRAFPSPDGLSVYFHNSSERKQVEEVLESITDAFYSLDREYRFTYVNRRSEELWEKSREDLLGKTLLEAFPQVAGSISWEQHLRAMAARQPVRFEVVSAILHRWMDVSIYPTANGGLSIYYRDISERKAAEDALRRSREDLQLAIDAAQLGTFFCDWPFDKIIWNETCKEHFFLPPDADVDFTLFYSLLHPDDQEPTRQAIDRAVRERADYNIEYRTVAPDGRTRWINAVGRVYYDTDGATPRRFDGITIDISQRKAIDEELRRRAEREALVNRIGQAIRASLDPEVIQATVSALLGEALHLDRCFYVTYDFSRDTLQAGQDWHRSDLPSVAGRYQASDYKWIIDEMFAEGTAIIPDTRTSRLSVKAAEAQESFGQRATVAVPFFSQGVLVAALFGAMTEPRLWTTEEVQVMEQTAPLTRAALETSYLNQKEHTIAQQLQDALQPMVPAEVPGLELADYYLPALEEAGVGGDFADVFTQNEDVTFLVVGDLSGKGLAAASQVATVRNMLRYALYNGRTLAGPITTLNETLAVHDLLNGFCTLFVGRYAARTRELCYVNCGQDAGLVRRATTGQIEPLPPTGPVLGTIAGLQYTEQCVTLAVGDVLALYTDGLTEAGPSRTALLTGDGVARLLQEQWEPPPSLLSSLGPSAAAIVSGVMAGVDAYAEKGIRDDQCLLVAVVRG